MSTEPKEFSPEFIAAIKAGEIPGWLSVTSSDKVADLQVALVDTSRGQAWQLKPNYPTTTPGYIYGKPAPVTIERDTSK